MLRAFGTASRHAAIAILLAVGASVPIHAQQPALSVSPDATDQRALVRVGPILASQELQDAALAGLPIRLRVRTELWKDEMFDDLVQTVNWSALLVYEPLNRRFYMRDQGSRAPARQFTTYELARQAIEGEIPVRLRPRTNGRYYYTATLEVETLSVSDLRELERWLQGELQPAVEGDQSIPGAIGEGAKRLLIKVLGVPTRRIEARSGRFRFPQ